MTSTIQRADNGRFKKGHEGYWKGKTRPGYWTGKKRPSHSIETRKKMSKAHKGSLSHNWQGGLTAKNQQVRASLEYRLWREAVFERDNYTCVSCGIRGVAIHADHIKSFSQYPDLRFDITNGRTLCVPCHKKTDTYLKHFKHGPR